MVCKECGHNIQREEGFCPGCGATVPQALFESAAAAASSTAAAGLPIGHASSTAQPDRPLTMYRMRASQAAAEPVPQHVEPVSQPAESIPQPVEPVSPPLERTADRKERVIPFPQPIAPADVLRSELAAHVAQESAPLESLEPMPVVPQTGRCPECGRPSGKNDLFCQSCGMKLVQQTTSPSKAAGQSRPLFAGFAYENFKTQQQDENLANRMERLRVASRINRARARLRTPKTHLPVLEILIAVLLLGGAAIAVWILHGSMPAPETPSNIRVTVWPASAEVGMGRAYDLSASIVGTDNTDVNWTIDEGDAGGRIIPRSAKSIGGAVSAQAVYIAPNTPGTFHVTATTKADLRKFDSAEITVPGPQKR